MRYFIAMIVIGFVSMSAFAQSQGREVHGKQVGGSKSYQSGQSQRVEVDVNVHVDDRRPGHTYDRERYERDRQREFERLERERQRELDRYERERQREIDRIERERQRELDRMRSCRPVYRTPCYPTGSRTQIEFGLRHERGVFGGTSWFFGLRSDSRR